MDRVDLPEDSRHEVGLLFEAALRAAAAEWSVADLDGIERRLQAVGRAVLGAVVERVLARRAAGEGTDRLPCPHCGGAMRRVDQARRRDIQGVGGDDTLHRAYDLCDACRCGQAPLDARIGLGPGTLSPALLRAVCRLGSEASVEEALDALRETRGTTVPDETARRDTEGSGAVAEADQQAAVDAARRGRPPPATAPIDTGVLAVAVDGVQAPHRDGWHEMTVGTRAPLGPALQVDAETQRAHLAWGGGARRRRGRGGRGVLGARRRRGLLARRGHLGSAHGGRAGRWRGVDLASRGPRPGCRRHGGGRDRGPLPRL